MTQYKTQYGTVFAVKEHNGSPAIMCRAEVSETWSLSSMITPFTPGAWTAEELQAQLDNWAATKGWQPVEAPASGEAPEIVDEGSEPDEECPYLQPLENSKKYSCQCALCGDKFVNREICNKSFRGCGWYQDQQEKDARQDDEGEIPTTDSCQCRTCEHESCFAHGCTKECPANAEESCLTTNCPEYQGKKDGTPCTDCRCPECDDDACPQSHCDKSDAGLGCMAPDDDCPPQNPTNAAPAYHAEAGAATQSPSAAGSASLAAEDMNVPAFDFGADAETNAALLQDAQIFMAGSMARVMAAKRAHDKTANNYRGSWGKWCDLVGISRDTGDNMVRVAEQFGNIQIDGQNLIDIQPLKLLYAASKPSAPAELVQAVKDGDITSHKQYQDALAEIRARDAKIKDLLEISEASDRRADEEERKCKEANEARIAAENKVQQYREIKDAALETAKQQREKTAAAESRARAAENRAAGAQKLAEQRGTENTELKAKIRELEDQPRDVAVVQPGEEQIEAWRREGADRMAATMQETVRKANEERLKAQNRVTYLQEQLATARPDADACQRTADTLYETAENLRILLRTQLKQAQLSPTAYGKVVAHVLQVARTLLDTVRVCAPDGYDIDSEEDDDFE